MNYVNVNIGNASSFMDPAHGRSDWLNFAPGWIPRPPHCSLPDLLTIQPNRSSGNDSAWGDAIDEDSDSSHEILFSEESTQQMDLDPSSTTTPNVPCESDQVKSFSLNNESSVRSSSTVEDDDAVCPLLETKTELSVDLNPTTPKIFEDNEEDDDKLDEIDNSVVLPEVVDAQQRNLHVLAICEVSAAPLQPLKLAPIATTSLFGSIFPATYYGQHMFCKPTFTTNELGIIGAIGTNDPTSVRNEICFFTWNRLGMFPDLRTQTRKTTAYKGKTWNRQKSAPDVASIQKKKNSTQDPDVKFCQGQVATSKITNPFVSDMAWLNRHQLLAACGKGEKFQLRVIRTEVRPSVFKSIIVSQPNYSRSAEVREMAVKDGRYVLLGGDDGRMDLIHSPLLNGSKTPTVSQWKFKDAVGSVRWNIDEPWIASCTTDDGFWHLIDMRSKEPASHAAIAAIGPQCYAHEPLPGGHFAAGSDQGIVSVWDIKMLTHPVYCIQDPFVTVIGDIYFDPHLGQLRLFGQPSMSVWNVAGQEAWEIMGTTQIDDMFQPPHSIIGTGVPDSSLVIGISELGNMALFEV